MKAGQSKLAAKEKGIIGQVGFVERYNEAFISCREFINNPKFIESHNFLTLIREN